MATAEINNNLDENSNVKGKNPCNREFEQVVGRIVDEISIYTKVDNKLNFNELFRKLVNNNDTENSKLAFMTLKDYADQDYTEAQYILGQYCYLMADDIQEAIIWHKKAADNENTRSQVCLAYLLIKKGEYQEAIKYLKLAGEVKDARAEVMYILGTLYRDGNGFAKNTTKAVNLFKEAADKNQTSAMGALAECYLYGIGVEKDVKKAIEYYTQASDLGDDIVVCDLVSLYLDSKEVEQNPQKAKEIWLKFIRKFGTNKRLNELAAKINKFTGDVVKETEDKNKTESDSDVYQIANRAYLTPLKLFPVIVTSILGVIMTIIFLCIVIFIAKDTLAYLLPTLFALLTIANIISLFKIKEYNKSVELNNTFTKYAILYQKDDFVILTDHAIHIDPQIITSINYKTDRFRPNLAVGKIIIKTANSMYFVDHVDNVIQTVITMNQLVNSIKTDKNE